MPYQFVVPANGNRDGDLPDGLFYKFAVQPSLQKYFASPIGRSSFIDSAVHPTEGRIAIVTDAGLDAMDAAATRDERRRCGRQSRVVLTPRRWRQVGGSDSAGDGGKKARSPGRARRKPLKPLRAGMPGDSGELAVNTRVHLPLPCAHEAAGALGTRHSPRPLKGGRKLKSKTRAKQAARSRSHVPRSSCPASSGASSTP
jgi:hypothetical protein